MIEGTVAQTITTTVVHVQFDRALIVIDKGLSKTTSSVEPEEREILVKLIEIHYKWVRNHWLFLKVIGHGSKRLRHGGTGYGIIATEAMHPDYREYAERYAPNWRPEYRKI